MKSYFKCFAKTTDGQTTLIANELYAKDEHEAAAALAAREKKTPSQLFTELKEIGVVSWTFVKEAE